MNYYVQYITITIAGVAAGFFLGRALFRPGLANSYALGAAIGGGGVGTFAGQMLAGVWGFESGILSWVIPFLVSTGLAMSLQKSLEYWMSDRSDGSGTS